MTYLSRRPRGLFRCRAQRVLAPPRPPTPGPLAAARRIWRENGACRNCNASRARPTWRPLSRTLRAWPKTSSDIPPPWGELASFKGRMRRRAGTRIIISRGRGRESFTKRSRKSRNSRWWSRSTRPIKATAKTATPTAVRPTCTVSLSFRRESRAANWLVNSRKVLRLWKVCQV